MAMEHEPIVFSLEAAEAEKSALEEERELHRQRAERFGTGYVDPAKLPKFALEARRERQRREGFATGIDLFSEEEAAKRAARALKFGLPEEAAPGAAYTLDPEEAKRAARAKKFGVEYAPPNPDTLLQKADLFEPRKDAPPDVPRREAAIYLYGVDVMSTADCLAYFEDYGPTLVEWINDSSCCVVFEDGGSARRAIAGTGHPLAGEDELAAAPDDMDAAMGELDAAAAMPLRWHKGRDFVKGRDARGKEIKVPLMYRMATDLDQKDPHEEKRSRFLWKGKRRREEGGRARRQRGDGGGEWEDAGGWEDGGDAEMQQARGRKRRARGKRRKGAEGDVDMADAQLDGGGGGRPADEGWIEVPQDEPAGAEPAAAEEG
ncbi:ncbp3 [Scenedesmus sp. PABB004]|nr:ncbp3 [Scenedesmus sp. PABB004]